MNVQEIIDFIKKKLERCSKSKTDKRFDNSFQSRLITTGYEIALNDILKFINGKKEDEQTSNGKSQ